MQIYIFTKAQRTFFLGIIKKDFPLSSQPVMGIWKVAVTAKVSVLD
jgi:hypothetical protein